jgi:hypothetical protein
MKPDQTPTRYSYAVSWPCGVATRTDTGQPIRRIHRFSTTEARDEWVEAGQPIRTNPDYREAVTAKEIRREIWRAHATCDADPWMGSDDGDHEVLV